MACGAKTDIPDINESGNKKVCAISLQHTYVRGESIERINLNAY